MRRTILALSLLATVPVAAQQQQAMEKEKDPKAAAALPAGWQLRLDDPRPGRPAPKPEDVKLVTMGSGYHITSGPAAIYFNPKDMASGAFTARATFAQSKPSGHEAYGMFIGGTKLSAPEQEYFYLVIRPHDGGFYVAHRAAAEVHAVVPWTVHPAVNKQDESGKAANELSMQVTADSVHLSVNGQRVKSFAKSEMHGFNTDGQVGLRVNHRLDLHIGTLEVKQN